MLVLDTNILIEIEKNNERVLNKLSELRKNNISNLAITSAVYAEFLVGFIKVGLRGEAEKYTAAFDVQDFDKRSAAILAELKLDLEKNGETIPIFDLLTASTVIANNGTLVTMDRHFEKIKNLDLILL